MHPPRRHSSRSFPGAATFLVVKIATWNVNSIRTRLPRLLAWLERRRPDVVCLQETKVADDQFPFAELARLGYTALVAGQQTYNGVAVPARARAQGGARRPPGDGGARQRRPPVARGARPTGPEGY